jgi:methylmalonyl-CoA/ethylmalonyl-CoA epimerase
VPGDAVIIDHIAVAVKSIETAARLWQAQFGYRQATEPVVNTRQKVRVVFLEKPGSLPVKLIEPTGPASPVFAFTQRGGGLHHLCFRVENLDASLAHLSAAGGRVVAPPQPGEAFDGERIAFVLAQPGLNVELIDTDKRRGRIASGPAGD